MVVVQKNGLKAGGWQIALSDFEAETWRTKVEETPCIMPTVVYLCFEKWNLCLEITQVLAETLKDMLELPVLGERPNLRGHKKHREITAW